MRTCKQLISGLQYKCIKGTEEKAVTKVVYDSRKAEPGCLFICIRGANMDSHDLAEEVVNQGAAVLIVEKEVKIPQETDVTIIRVKNTRYAMAFISAEYFNRPAEEMKIIGITGTKGKSTITYLMKSMLELSGYKVGLIGTIETIIGDKVLKSHITTPESYVLQQYFREMADAGCDMVVMEVSSQALMLHRTQGFIFDVGIFTNLHPDHIGPNEHVDFDHYMHCKSLLFRQCRVGFFNKDDNHCRDMMKDCTCEVKTYGFHPMSDLYGEDMKLENENGRLGVSFQIKGDLELSAYMSAPGRFSVYNGLAAVSVCHYFKVPSENIRQALGEAKVRGRIESVPGTKGYSIMIDYAHNAMSLESLLKTLREYEPKRLVCLFGCGGNRSRIRRYEMGEVSGRLADLTIITSDNPRFEEPEDIIGDIRTGIGRTEGEYVEICDRREAITYAVRNARSGDVIVVAGKGHEDYQEIKGVKYPMDDRELVKEALKTAAGEE